MQTAFDDRILAEVIAATGQVACMPEAPITAATRFAEDLGMDSLDVTEVVLAIEETFDTEIAPDLTSDLERVGDFARLLSRRVFGDAGLGTLARTS